jgi:hypothetical protein
MKSADDNFLYLDLAYSPCPDGSPAKAVDRFGFRCPRGVGSGDFGNRHPGFCLGLNLRDRGHDIPRKSWHWNGDIDAPSFTPSVNCGICGWHGFIIAGKFKEA